MRGVCPATVDLGRQFVAHLRWHVQQEHASRLSFVAEPTREELLTIEAADVERAITAIEP